jgi:membrane protein
LIRAEYNRCSALSKTSTNRGRTAERPQQIPASGWWDIIVRVKSDLSRDNVSLVAGGLAMYSLLSLFPALAAAVSFYGLLFTPADVIKHMNAVSGLVPPGLRDIFNSGLQDVASRQTGTLTVAAVLAVLVALASARSGMAALMQAANIAYQEREKRGLFKQLTISMAFALGATLGFIVMLLLAGAVPLLFEAFTSSPWVERVVVILRWTLLWAFAVLGLAVTYRFAPARELARWRWVTWGSVVAATLWVTGSLLFAFYLRTFGSYAKMYGALGGVVVLLMWFYLSSFFVVLGAEINAEMERQTKQDTTEGAEVPMGQRGAHAADSVGPSAAEMGQAKRSL